MEYAARMRELLANLRDVLSSIKRIALEHAPGARVYLFGSAARGSCTASSDVDVLVVVDELGGVDAYKLKAAVKRAYPGYPIEVHVVDRATLERWYRRFVKEGELVEV